MSIINTTFEIVNSTQRGNMGRGRGSYSSSRPSGEWSRGPGIRRGGSGRMRRKSGCGDGVPDSSRAAGDVYALDRGLLI